MHTIHLWSYSMYIDSLTYIHTYIQIYIHIHKCMTRWSWTTIHPHVCNVKAWVSLCLRSSEKTYIHTCVLPIAMANALKLPSSASSSTFLSYCCFFARSLVSVSFTPSRRSRRSNKLTTAHSTTSSTRAHDLRNAATSFSFSFPETNSDGEMYAFLFLICVQIPR